MSGFSRQTWLNSFVRKHKIPTFTDFVLTGDEETILKAIQDKSMDVNITINGVGVLKAFLRVYLEEPQNKQHYQAQNIVYALLDRPEISLACVTNEIMQHLYEKDHKMHWMFLLRNTANIIAINQHISLLHEDLIEHSLPLSDIRTKAHSALLVPDSQIVPHNLTLSFCFQVLRGVDNLRMLRQQQHIDEDKLIDCCCRLISDDRNRLHSYTIFHADDVHRTTVPLDHYIDEAIRSEKVCEALSQTYYVNVFKHTIYTKLLSSAFIADVRQRSQGCSATHVNYEVHELTKHMRGVNGGWVTDQEDHTPPERRTGYVSPWQSMSHFFTLWQDGINHNAVFDGDFELLTHHLIDFDEIDTTNARLLPLMVKTLLTVPCISDYDPYFSRTFALLINHVQLDVNGMCGRPTIGDVTTSYNAWSLLREHPNGQGEEQLWIVARLLLKHELIDVHML